MFLGSFLILSQLLRLLQINSGLWESYKKDFNKTYCSKDLDELRRNVFFDNMNAMMLHGLAYKLGLSNYQTGVNQFSDMTFQEFSSMNSADDVDSEILEKLLLVIIPSDGFASNGSSTRRKSFDWRDYGAVTKVRDQKLCGACYAMSTVAAVESHLFLKTGNLVELSVQEVVDCADEFVASGCEGGIAQGVFSYISRNGGISSAADYPFAASAGKCRAAGKTKVEVNMQQYVYVPVDDKVLKLVIATVGPVIAMMDINNESFMRYLSGIYKEPNCSKEDQDLNHAVLIVGYGSENDEDFWIVKNSYGVRWGENGYMRIARNHCGISTRTYYPLIE